MTADQPSQQIEKARRKGGPRSRSGCSNCKQRRVKCDETHPKCQRCIKRGLECQGLPQGNITTAYTSDVVSSRSISSYAIPFRVPGSQHERQLLHYFCVQAATDLSGYLVSDFWTRIVLRRSQAELVVRQAVVALASLHQDEGTSSASSDVLYNKAMRSMRKYLSHRRKRNQQAEQDPSTFEKLDYRPQGGSSSGSSSSERVVSSSSSSSESSMVAPLICCALFYSFESIQGNANAAMKHLSAGLGILDAERARQDELGGEDSDDLRDLEHIFSRLDLQAGIYDESTYVKLQQQRRRSTSDYFMLSPETPMATESKSIAYRLYIGEVEGQTVQPFCSIDEAQRYLTDLQVRTRQFMMSSAQYRYCSWDMIDPQVNLNQLVLRNEYAVWGWRFSEFLGRPDEDFPSYSTNNIWQDFNIHEAGYPATVAPTVRGAMEHRKDPGIGMLYIHFYMFYLILASGLPDDPGLYNRPATRGSTQCPIDIILDMVEAMMAVESTAVRDGDGGSNSQSRPISAETGLVATVFLMASRSDNINTVKRALAILERSKRREGLYDAKIVAALTKKVMEIHMGEAVEKGEVPGHWAEGRNLEEDSEVFWYPNRERETALASRRNGMVVGQCFIDTCSVGGSFEGLAKRLGVTL